MGVWAWVLVRCEKNSITTLRTTILLSRMCLFISPSHLVASQWLKPLKPLSFPYKTSFWENWICNSCRRFQNPIWCIILTVCIILLYVRWPAKVILSLKMAWFFFSSITLDLPARTRAACGRRPRRPPHCRTLGLYSCQRVNDYLCWMFLTRWCSKCFGHFLLMFCVFFFAFDRHWRVIYVEVGFVHCSTLWAKSFVESTDCEVWCVYYCRWSWIKYIIFIQECLQQGPRQLFQQFQMWPVVQRAVQLHQVIYEICSGNSFSQVLGIVWGELFFIFSATRRLREQWNWYFSASSTKSAQWEIGFENTCLVIQTG